MYSEDLSNMIKTLLQVNPKKRPSCDEIVKMPIILEKIKELGLDNDQSQLSTVPNNELLGTIKIPKNLRILRDKLPKPHYYKSVEAAPEPRFLPAIRSNSGLNKIFD